MQFYCLSNRKKLQQATRDNDAGNTFYFTHSKKKKDHPAASYTDTLQLLSKE